MQLLCLSLNLHMAFLHELSGTLPTASLKIRHLLQARVGRKEAELAGRTPSRQARPGTSELEPLSIAQRRVVAVNRGPRASPAHAPKFASPAPIDGTGPR